MPGPGSIPVPKPSTARDKKATKLAKVKQWQRVQQVVKVRDGGRCRACGTREGVDVHHIKFRSLGGADDTKNCCLLCRLCHADIHGYRLALDGDANRRLRVSRT